MLFSNMIEKSYPISKPRIKETLEKKDWGVEMFNKVSLDTIVNRLKYERCQNRDSKMRKQ